MSLDKNKKHNIEIVVDRLVLKEGIKTRLTDSVEMALDLANGLMIAASSLFSRSTGARHGPTPSCRRAQTWSYASSRCSTWAKPFASCPA
ncbi:MAG: hypothetical protein R3287_10865 [Anderseniella sp.]|nr:hypothetical protein [Anderseniella sp.]